MRTCDLPGCDRVHDAHGLCSTHLWRQVQHGDPLAHIPIDSSLYRAGGVLKLGQPFDLTDSGDL